MLRNVPLLGLFLVQARELYLVVVPLAKKGLLCARKWFLRNFVDLLHLCQLV